MKRVTATPSQATNSVLLLMLIIWSKSSHQSNTVLCPQFVICGNSLLKVYDVVSTSGNCMWTLYLYHTITNNLILHIWFLSTVVVFLLLCNFDLRRSCMDLQLCYYFKSTGNGLKSILRTHVVWKQWTWTLKVFDVVVTSVNCVWTLYLHCTIAKKLSFAYLIPICSCCYLIHV